jgi:DHA2 family multidrug resistance protein
MLWKMTYAQAETLSYGDAFRAIMLAFALAVCLVPLMKKVAPPKAPAATAH